MKTIAQAKKELASWGITLRKVENEYRVNFKNGIEATACYETDIEAAIGTGIAMAQWLANEDIKAQANMQRV